MSHEHMYDTQAAMGRVSSFVKTTMQRMALPYSPLNPILFASSRCVRVSRPPAPRLPLQTAFSFQVACQPTAAWPLTCLCAPSVAICVALCDAFCVAHCVSYALCCAVCCTSTSVSWVASPTRNAPHSPEMVEPGRVEARVHEFYRLLADLEKRYPE
jgi:hypothetical protein